MAEPDSTHLQFLPGHEAQVQPVTSVSIEKNDRPNNENSHAHYTSNLETGALSNYADEQSKEWSGSISLQTEGHSLADKDEIMKAKQIVIDSGACASIEYTFPQSEAKFVDTAGSRKRDGTLCSVAKKAKVQHGRA